MKLDDVNEATILQNLRLRFAENLMYTSLGTIIVSINPYFRIPGLYDDDVAREYRGGSFELEPHVFQVAERAYSGLLDSRNNQAIIISGESGAGKTEATKQCLKFIAVNAGSSSSGVQDRILAANPLLEAFGNAKTLRNDNSSRFGKWMTNGFDANGIICSCKNINYLLETSRVVTHQEGERNFHIFYMLIAGASTDLQASLHLDGRGSEDFQFTNQSSVTQLPGKTEVDMFREVEDAISTLGFTSKERMELFSAVATTLHFGNIEFSQTEEDDDSCTFADDKATSEAVRHVSSLLDISANALENSLVKRTITSGRNSVIKVNLDAEKARENKNAFAKALYGNCLTGLCSVSTRPLQWTVIQQNPVELQYLEGSLVSLIYLALKSSSLIHTSSFAST